MKNGPNALPALDDLHVLVVEDDEDARQVTAEALRACRAHVAEAGSAHEAVALLTQCRVDLLVTDIAMPGRDGYWLARRARELAATALPVIAVSGSPREPSSERRDAEVFEEYVVKPVDPFTLCDIVARVAGR